jgi:hypothetical protein
MAVQSVGAALVGVCVQYFESSNYEFRYFEFNVQQAIPDGK